MFVVANNNKSDCEAGFVRGFLDGDIVNLSIRSIIVRSYFVFSTVSPIAALLLTATMATAQDSDTETRERNCELITVNRGENAELVPDDLRSPDQAHSFPFLMNDDGLLEEFRVDEEKRRDCLAGFGIIFGASAGVPAAGGFAGAGFSAGLGTIGIVGAAVGIGAVGLGVGIVGGLVSGGSKKSSSNSTTCTTCN